jgi:SAM-dependent MidA family methyltransferase
LTIGPQADSLPHNERVTLTPLDIHIRELIRTGGPLSFDRFMECALYHPEYGYYRSGREVFGRDGDFFTAAQLQPVFGDLMQAFVGSLASSSGIKPFEVVELGAGRADLAPFLQEWNYRAVDFRKNDSASPELPRGINGLILAHEFFDALPVRLLQRNLASGGDEEWSELLVSIGADGQLCCRPAFASTGLLEYAHQYGGPIPIGGLLEVNEGIPLWCERISQVLSSGFLLVFDYGYKPRELLRFPAGTLLSYRHHQTFENVLAYPGERDITAHVNFAWLTKAAQEAGFRLVGEQSLGTWALSVWPEEVMAAGWQRSTQQWKMQWKQLVFGMGESFHVRLFRKATPSEPRA